MFLSPNSDIFLSASTSLAANKSAIDEKNMTMQAPAPRRKDPAIKDTEASTEAVTKHDKSGHRDQENGEKRTKRV
jgi:hypothetical protein